MAPEILLKQEYNKSVDIWSAGVVMYQLISGRHPMKDLFSNKIEKYISLFEEKTVIKYEKKDGFTKLSIDLL